MPVSEEHPGSIQTWTYDGMVITLQGSEPASGKVIQAVRRDQVGVYFVKWAGNNLDQLNFTVIDDPCANRLMGMQWGN